MFRFRKIKMVMALLMQELILLKGPGSAGYAATGGKQQKHETVYVNLYHDGSVLKQSVVNRINYAGSQLYEDYGEYKSIKALNLRQHSEVSGSRDLGCYRPETGGIALRGGNRSGTAGQGHY